ncbi:MAG: S8 family peptidase [Phycisphaerales bacterium]|nr:S8 family peptidase [Phycisphaerales bacterium]
MLALAIIPLSPRVAMGSAAACGGDGASGPFIDPDLIRAMEEKPDAEHAIIVVARLSRAPFDLESMLPAPDEYNACTARWLVWEDLRQRCEKGEDISEAELETAEREARDFDRSLVDKQETAYEAHYWDYAAIVAQDVPQVLEEARAILGTRVRQLHEASQLLPATATRDEIEKLCGVAGIKEIWLDLPIEPQLDISRLSIEADRVHNGEVAGVPYTGAGVKVAVVDSGLAPDHPRLPIPTAANQKNFACRDGRDATDWCECTFGHGHGTNVTGIIFAQEDDCCLGGDCPAYCEGQCSDPSDQCVGIAPDATIIIGKIIHEVPLFGCPPCGQCTPCPNNYYPPNWSLFMEGLSWAATFPAEIGPNADVISSSLAGAEYNQHSQTTAQHVTALNLDWIINSGGAVCSQACGNSGTGGVLPPSGACNAISVGAYDDQGTVSRADDTLVPGSSQGPTADLRRKPDVCAPGGTITTTAYCYDPPNDLMEEFGATSSASPHVGGTLALLKEARPSLTPRQAHAIIVNSAVPYGGNPEWQAKPGWGQLNAFQAVSWRNRLHDGTVSDPNDMEVVGITTVPAGATVIASLVWHRAMMSEVDPVEDENGNPSPASLELFLERKLSPGSWALVDSDVVAPNAGSDGKQEDNSRRVSGDQAAYGQPQYLFRVRVEHNPTLDSPFSGAQSFTLACSHALVVSP